MADGRALSLAYVLVAYFVSCMIGWEFMDRVASGASPFERVVIADVVMCFLFSVAVDNTSVYDPYWSVAPMVVAPYLALSCNRSALAARQQLVCILVLGWGGRLTFNWVRSWPGMHHEDWRYIEFRHMTGKYYQIANLIALQLAPTFMVLAGCAALVPSLVSGGNPLSALDALAALCCAGGAVIQGVADEQMLSFRLSRQRTGAVMDQGLWAFSRHPNYFGEVSFWCGLSLFALAAGGPDATWQMIGLGPLTMIALFAGYSVPAMERRQVLPDLLSGAKTYF